MKSVFAMIVAGVVFLASCQNSSDTDPAEQVVVVREVDSYQSIEVNSNVNVVIRVTVEDDIKIKCAKNSIDKVHTSVLGGVLIVDCVDMNSSDAPVLYVSDAALKLIVNKGNGALVIRYCHAGDNDPECEGIVDTEDSLDIVTIDIRGTGSVTLENADINVLNSEIRGNGSLTLTGVIDIHNCIIRGTGNLEAPNAQTKQMHIEVIGTGSANVWVTDILNVIITGSGDVRYKGEPVIQSEITGEGKLIKVG